MNDRKRPGGELAARPLHFFWIADCSGSMALDGKIQSLNTAVKDALPETRDAAAENPYVQVLMRVITFSSGAQWHVSQPTRLEQFTWQDLTASGVTDMGHAFRLLADQLKIPPMSERALPPVLVLLSDGQPTDDYKSGLHALFEQPWARKAVRIAIAIGDDADLNVLQKFIDHVELRPLLAKNPEALALYIRWASTAVLKAASAPASQTSGAPPTGNVPIPMPPDPGPSSAADVW